MVSWNVIQGKLYKGERLTVEEIKRANAAFEEFDRTHAIWIEYPNIWECSNCKFWIMRPDVIEAYHYCPRCGAKMEVKKMKVTRHLRL